MTVERETTPVRCTGPTLRRERTAFPCDVQTIHRRWTAVFEIAKAERTQTRSGPRIWAWDSEDRLLMERTDTRYVRGANRFIGLATTLLEHENGPRHLRWGPLAHHKADAPRHVTARHRLIDRSRVKP